MVQVKNEKELKAALTAKETLLHITDSKLAKKVWAAYKVKKYAPKLLAVVGVAATATVGTGPLGTAGMGAAATALVTAVSLSTGVQITLIVACVVILAILRDYNVEIIYADKEGNVSLKFNK